MAEIRYAIKKHVQNVLLEILNCCIAVRKNELLNYIDPP